MCLILFGYRCHPHYRLVLAANRDEFLNRPAEPLGLPYPDEQIYCGRDLQAGGTWLAVSEKGWLGAITNYRDPARMLSQAPSRGEIITGYLRSAEGAEQFLHRFGSNGSEYNGFNLLLMDSATLWYHSNVSAEMRPLGPGVYGLSNSFLDTGWPKVRRGRELFSKALQAQDLVASLLQVLTDDYQPVTAELPDTGVGAAWEKLLAPAFIRSSGYGTRCSSVVLVGYDGSVRFVEQGWVHGQTVREGERRELHFSING